MYTNAYNSELRVIMYELEANVKTFIENKINSGDYRTKDFRVFVGKELFVEETSQRTEVTLNLKYKGMS
jgi:hypothetical protein